MNSVLCFCLLALAVVNATPLFEFDSEEELSPMIVNGIAPRAHDHTEHAVILFATQKSAQDIGRLGGGSIIHERAVLTAAHLVADIDLVRIGYGSNDVESMKVTQSRKIVRHPQFNPVNRANDIAIIFITGRFDLKLASVAAIALPAQNRKIPTTVRASTVGFGFIAPQGQNGPTSSILVADVTIIEPRTCERLFRRAFDGHLCARDKAKEQAANVCLGDNGNGLYVLPSALNAADRDNEQDPPAQDDAAQDDPPAQDDAAQDDPPAQETEGNNGFDDLPGFEPEDTLSRKRRANDDDPPQQQPPQAPRERPLLIGIASVFSNNCEPGRAGGYTRVAAHSDWVQTELKKRDNKPPKPEPGVPGNPPQEGDADPPQE